MVIDERHTYYRNSPHTWGLTGLRPCCPRRHLQFPTHVGVLFGVKIPEGDPFTEVMAKFDSYWGKAQPGQPGEYHTVLGHSLDVAACAYLLLEQHPVLRARISALGVPEGSTSITMAGFCSAHDVGKFDTRFQMKAPKVAGKIRPFDNTTLLNKVSTTYHHGVEGYRLVEEDPEAYDVVIRYFGEYGPALLRAVCGHHGVIPSSADPAANRIHVPKTLRSEDTRTRRDFLALVGQFFQTQGAHFPWEAPVDGVLLQYLSGLCTVADWVGSNTDHFPYLPGPIEDLQAYWEEAVVRAHQGLADSGLLRKMPHTTKFESLFPGYTPRDVQTVTERLDGVEPSITIVEAEMGLGKTEASLSLAFRFLVNGVSEGITYALPTMATSNAMLARVVDVAENAWDEVTIALTHSRSKREPLFKSILEGGQPHSDSDAEDASVVCTKWLAGKKRALLAQVGVGTVDQALQAGLALNHQFVRMFALSRNVLIIDEVHAYDAYMTRLLEHLLGWLGAMKVPVILLSATLPAERKSSLIAAWQGRDKEGTTSLKDALSQEYPLVTTATCTGTPRTATTESKPSPRAVFVGQVHPSEVPQRLVDAARAGARAVWIRNTVAEAQEAYEAVRNVVGSRVDVTLFHARYQGRDRTRIEGEVLRKFGKSAPPGGRVLIATQVVEQSLDLDFDVLYSDLCPSDLFLQRIGRLHRHRGRPRPLGFEQPVAYWVHDPEAGFGPSKWVYDTGTLWVSKHLLQQRESLELPGDIRALVEQTYHPESRQALLAQAGEDVLKAEASMLETIRVKEGKAQQNCIPTSDLDMNGRESLSEGATVFPLTRDGSSETLLLVDWDGQCGRALYSENNPPWNLDAKASGSFTLMGEMLDQTVSIPTQCEVAGAPPRSSSDAWESWCVKFKKFAKKSELDHVQLVPLTRGTSGGSYYGALHYVNRGVPYDSECSSTYTVKKISYNPIVGFRRR